MEDTTASKIGLAAFLILCIAWQVHTQVNCTVSGPGRHPNTADTTCHNYTLCVYVTANSTYLAYSYTCPTTSVFNPNTALCTSPSNYTCTATG